MTEASLQEARPDTYEGYRQQHDRKLRKLGEQFQQASNIVDLRSAWIESELVNNIAGYVSEGTFDEFRDGVREKFAELGIDWEANDERVQMLKEALESGEPPDQHGGVEMGYHSKVGHHLYRLISGCDPTAKEGLRLKPLESLNAKPHSIQERALAYTSSDEYTIWHRFPRKAARTVTDPTSPFWGFGIKTDTWPMGSGGAGAGPNISLWMPTGLIPREEIIRTEESGSSQSFMKDNPHYTPRRICVQSLSLGHRDPGSRQVDTNSSLVGQFLESIKTD